MARIGKIARLPQYLRAQLNQRLADGEPGRVLVPWLNEHSAVQPVLAEYFRGQPITEQNLSEWRNGGYEEWLRHQEEREFTRSFLAQAEELEEEVGETPLTDRAMEVAAVALLRLLREAEAKEGDARRVAVLEIVREMQRLRRGDHARGRLLLRQERWQTERDEVEQAELEKMGRRRDFREFVAGLKAQGPRTEEQNDPFPEEEVMWRQAPSEKSPDSHRQAAVPTSPPNPVSPGNSSGPAKSARKQASADHGFPIVSQEKSAVSPPIPPEIRTNSD